MSQTKIPNVAVSLPWWRERVMWLVVGGPSLVVVASFITLALALAYPDPVLDDHARIAADNAAEHATAKEASAPGGAVNPSLLPAMKARNHAATGGH